MSTARIAVKFANMITSRSLTSSKSLLFHHSRDFSLDDYLNIALSNLRATSRTIINGSIDLSTSNTKTETLNLQEMSCEELKNKCTHNYIQSMKHVYEVKSFKSSEDIKDFIGIIATTLGKGITSSDHWLRSYDSEKFSVYTKVEDLNLALDQFCDEFIFRFNNLIKYTHHDEILAEAISLCAWIEYRVNLTDHFLADGCGRTAAIMCNFVFMRMQIPPECMPVITKQNYYDENFLPKTRRGTNSSIENAEFNIWLNHYRVSLFTTYFSETKMEKSL